MSLLNILWPTDTDYSPGCIGRLGRVLHWTFTAISVGLVGLGFSLVDPVNITDEAGAAFGAAAGFYALGRGIRYIMAGE